MMKAFGRLSFASIFCVICAVIGYFFYDSQCEVIFAFEDGSVLSVREPANISFDQGCIRMEFPRNTKSIREFLYPREGRQVSVWVAGVPVFNGKSRVGAELDPGGDTLRITFPTGASTFDAVKKLKDAGVSIEYLTYDFR